MLSEDWIELLRMIPENQQNVLVLTTLTGIDLNIEVILRFEPSYLVFRGRVAGQTDDGRIFFLPYRQIDYLQLNRETKETEIRKLYGDMSDGSVASRPSSGVFNGMSQSGAFAAISASSHGLSTSPNSPSAPAPAVPTRPSLPGIAARLTTNNGAGQSIAGRLSNGPTRPGTPPPAGYTNGASPAEGPTPPRNSILERLRAQRNSVISTKPAGR
jgi:hypothetical protein